MPEFIMPEGDNPERWNALPPFVQGFIEALFFCEQSPAYSMGEWFGNEAQEALAEGTSDGTIPSDATFEHLHPDSLAKLTRFCEAWRANPENARLLALAFERGDYDEMQAGRDLYFTHCGHGVGFWDRRQLEADGLGDKLSAAAGRGDVNPFFGDHVEHGDAPFVHVELY